MCQEGGSLPPAWPLGPNPLVTTSNLLHLICSLMGSPSPCTYSLWPARPRSPLLTPAWRENTQPPGGGDRSSSSGGNVPAPPRHPPRPAGARSQGFHSCCPETAAQLWNLARLASLRFGTRNRSVLSASPAPLKVKPRWLATPCPVGQSHSKASRVCFPRICQQR